jgi:hypothetical protein
MIYDFENYRMLHKLRQKITLKIKKYEDLGFNDIFKHIILFLGHLRNVFLN